MTLESLIASLAPGGPPVPLALGASVDEAWDAFARAALALRRRWGRPREIRLGGGALVTWPWPSRGRLWWRKSSLTLLFTGAGEAQLALARPAPVGLPPPGPAPVAPRPAPVALDLSDWPRLTASLARRLYTLDDDDPIVLAGSDGYVQFFAATGFVADPQAMGYLVGEAVGDAYLAPAALTAGQRQRLVDLGWTEPPPGEEANWTVELAWPALSAEYRRIAGMAVRTLREVYGVATPADLTP